MLPGSAGTGAREFVLGGEDLMFSEDDKHCRECICRLCDLRGTDECIEGGDLCDKCQNDEHTGGCVYFDGE